MEFHLKTVNDVLFRACSAGPERVFQWRDESGAWHPVSGNQLYQRVRAFAAALSSWGIAKGDRVAILSENRWEWAVADFAVLALGAVDVPLYPTLTARQIGDMLADSGARAVLVSDVRQYEKVAAVRERTSVEHVVAMNRLDESAHALWFGDWMPAGDEDARADRDPAFDRRAYDVQSGDLATIIYTSGTTGEPKGVMLTHGNLASNLNVSTAGFSWDRSDSYISFLPLSHITARHVDYSLYCHGVVIAYCPQFDLIPRALQEIRPTVFVGVPRVYEKVRYETLRRAGESRLKVRLLKWALRRGRKCRDMLLAGKRPTSLLWKAADRLVFGKIRDGFGGRVGTFISGGAPLGEDTAGWFLDAGIRIQEGYGLTETSPVIALNTAIPSRLGSVGKKISNVETRFEPDGELLVRGPSVFSGYWNNPEATAEAFDSEGWFRTGDIVRIDPDGFLFITDRKKDLLKTSGGKSIAPQAIETRLKEDVLVAHAAVIGDRHKYACAIIAPNFPALDLWARSKGIPCEPRQKMLDDSRVQAVYATIVERVNASLASFETLKRFCVVAEDWAMDSGELTPSMKLKRHAIEQRYAPEIAAMYADEASSHK
jgi:long-chain acyl-CoA synthetase